MASTVDVAGQAPAASPAQPVRRLISISAVFVVLQTLAIDYGSDDAGAAVLWLIVGLVTVWLVHRGSRVARAVTVIGAMFGAAIYSFGIFGDGHAALLVVLYLGQALPLLTRQVREHVGAA